LLGFRISGEEVGRRHRVDHLLHGEADPLLFARPGFDRVGQRRQEMRVQQIGRGAERRQRIGGPLGRGKTAVVQDRRFHRRHLLP
jgi:hypothetical protein